MRGNCNIKYSIVRGRDIWSEEDGLVNILIKNSQMGFTLTLEGLLLEKVIRKLLGQYADLPAQLGI